MANLLELYMHDFSEFFDLELGPDGRFGYSNLSHYWLEPNRYPFLVRVFSRLAGLILVKRGSEISGNAAVWDMAEFFVVRGYRRLGIGTAIAQEVWKRFLGRWEVRVMESNHSAHRFWEHAITEFAGEAAGSVRVEKGDRHWRLFSFDSGELRNN
jgi:predicted acetyltransferase